MNFYNTSSVICQSNLRSKGGGQDAETALSLAVAVPHALEQDSVYHLPQVWADYINSLCDRWTWYGHFTFRDYPHIERAVKTWDYWEHAINKFVYGRRYWKHGKDARISFVRATENQRRGSPHFHAVIGNIPGNVPRMKFLDLWNDIAGFCRLWGYEKNKGAEFYMSKSTYAWKKGEIDISGNLPCISLNLC
jgi:hypothetical protein